MKRTIQTIITLLFVVTGLDAAVSAQAQNQTETKQPSPEEVAAKEADRLGLLLDLEDWQIFYVDSTLQHDFAALEQELKTLQGAKVGNRDLYLSVQDKWMEQIDATYHRLFTEEQWAKYLKNGAARAQKARAKRKAKAGKATAIQNN